MRSQIVQALGWCLGCMLLSCFCGNTVAKRQSSLHMTPHTCVYVCVGKPCSEFFWFLFSICQLSESPLRMSLFSQTPSRPQGDGFSSVPRNSGKNHCGKEIEGSGLLTCHSKTGRTIGVVQLLSHLWTTGNWLPKALCHSGNRFLSYLSLKKPRQKLHEMKENSIKANPKRMGISSLPTRMKNRNIPNWGTFGNPFLSMESATCFHVFLKYERRGDRRAVFSTVLIACLESGIVAVLYCWMVVWMSMHPLRTNVGCLNT